MSHWLKRNFHQISNEYHSYLETRCLNQLKCNFENFFHKEQILRNLLEVNTILCMKCMKHGLHINLLNLIKGVYYKE